MPTIGHRDCAEIAAGGTRDMHVAPGDHRHLGGGWSGRAGRVGVVDAGGVRALDEPQLHLTKSHPGRSLKARYATTQSATPVATAMAACCTVAQAAPPPW